MTRLLARLGLAAALCAGLSVPAAMAQGRITIGTNPQGSLYYTVGGGMAAVLQEALKRPVTVQPFTGSSVYMPLISSGEVTVGINSSLDAGAFRNGDWGNEPTENLRMLARLWPLYVAYFVRADSGMTEIKDLKGKRAVVDFSALAAVTEVNKAMLQAGGLELSDVQNVTVAGLPQGVDGLVEGTLDATSAAVGIPLTQQAHASIPGGIRYLSITGDKATSEAINGIFPGTYLVTLDPTPRMPELTEPTTIVAYDVFLVGSSDMSDEEATAILSTLYDAMPKLRTDYPAIAAASQEKMSLDTNTVPYHPAAVAFFKEKGIWSEANEAREASFK